MDDSDAGNLSIDPDLIEQVLEERAGKPGRGRWQRRGSFMPREWELRLQQTRARPATIWLAHELLYQKWRAEQSLYGPGAGRSRCPARWRKEPDYPPDPRQMHSTNWNAWD